jgi:hypothetical protein
MAHVLLRPFGCALATLALLVSAGPARAQAKKTPDEVRASLEAHKGDFDYLLGDWEFTAVRKTPEGDQKFRGSGARCASTRGSCSTSTASSATRVKPGSLPTRRSRRAASGRHARSRRWRRRGTRSSPSPDFSDALTPEGKLRPQ